MALDAETIDGFAKAVLARRFDNPKPTPKFHKELWDMCCSKEKKVVMAAPRGHAKSTAVTHTYTLASVLFREKQFVILVSDTEGQGTLFLNDIKTELRENEDLIELFGVSKFLKDTETDIVVQMSDGHCFKIIVKGSEQKVRGLKWRGKRPDLIVGDDLENDEIVMNKERREKFRNWFYGALLPCLSDTGVIRVVGTVLHLDSLLERLLTDSTWVSKRYAAHSPDYKEILWPEKFSKARLKEIRQGYVNQGFPEGYSQEYLNYPIDESNAFFFKSDFKEIRDKEEPVLYYAAADLAISQKERADYTVIAIAGVNSVGKVKVVDVRRGRWNSLDIIDELFAVQKAYSPEIFTLEAGVIQKSIGPVLYAEMHKRGIYMNINPMVPTKDKTSRARSLQARMRAGGVEFDQRADWFDTLQNEMLRFPRDVHDDQVDALAWIGLTLDKLVESPTQKEIEEEEYWDEVEDGFFGMGRNYCTGY